MHHTDCSFANYCRLELSIQFTPANSVSVNFASFRHQVLDLIYQANRQTGLARLLLNVIIFFITQGLV